MGKGGPFGDGGGVWAAIRDGSISGETGPIATGCSCLILLGVLGGIVWVVLQALGG